MKESYSKGINKPSHRSREHEFYLVDRKTTFLQHQQLLLVPKPIPSIRLGNGKDLRGRVFVHLTAIKPIGRRKSGLIWQCRCICGVLLIRPAKTLLNSPGNQSCGCKDYKRYLQIFEVQEIRLLLHSSSVLDIAKEYGVSVQSIYDIKNKKSWLKH